MRPEAVTQALLKVPTIINLVGSRLALGRLPENSAYPAIVYSVISGTPIVPINAQAGGTIMRTRVQIMALGKTVADVKTILEQVRLAMNYKSGLINGVQVISVVRDLIGPDSKDDDAAVFIQSHDYMITYQEP